MWQTGEKVFETHDNHVFHSLKRDKIKTLNYSNTLIVNRQSITSFRIRILKKSFDVTVIDRYCYRYTTLYKKYVVKVANFRTECVYQAKVKVSPDISYKVSLPLTSLRFFFIV